MADALHVPSPPAGGVDTAWRPVPLTVAAGDADDVDRLGERIAEFSARIQAATYHLLVMIREFDEREGWGGGFRSCAHWLNWRTGLNLGAAREKVRTARALADLPQISAAMRQGRVSYSKVRSLTKVATPDNEERLLDFALAGTAAQTERLVRSWRRVDRIAEAERDERRRSSRSLVMYTDEDGMFVVKGRLDPETGAVFRRALDAAADRLYEQEQQRRQSESAAIEPEDPIEHRRADALALVAESALTADLNPGAPGDHYQVVVHVDAAVLKETEPGEPGTSGMAMLEDGIDVSAETSRRIACDCATVSMTHDDDGRILDAGRKTRTISPAMRRSLRYRDRGCRFPGCGVTVCDGHHVRHWADGGATNLDNLLLLCRRHHRAVHEEGFRVEMLADGEARFWDRQGRLLPQAPEAPELRGASAWELVAYAAPDGIPIDPWTGTATDGGVSVDYGFALDCVRFQWEDAVVSDDFGAGDAVSDGTRVLDDGAKEVGVPDERVLDDGLPDDANLPDCGVAVGIQDDGLPDDANLPEREPVRGDVSAETSGPNRTTDPPDGSVSAETSWPVPMAFPRVPA